MMDLERLGDKEGKEEREIEVKLNENKQITKCNSENVNIII